MRRNDVGPSVLVARVSILAASSGNGTSISIQAKSSHRMPVLVQLGSAISQRRTSASSAAAQIRRQSSITGRLPADLIRMRGPETGTGGNPFARSRSRSAVSGGSRWAPSIAGLMAAPRDGTA